MTNEEKKANTPAGATPLEDEQLEQANGGIKIVLLKKPKLINTILRLIFKIKDKKQ